ncbi:MAG: InlB B-repeat-containing protein [Clostridium sp.]|nr:InlB B-repeat-containing protein [Clostridium sp.]
MFIQTKFHTFHGNTSDHKVSQYVTNEDVTNELGSVTLVNGNVTHNVVTFHSNNSSTTEETSTQNIVTSTNSRIEAPTFTRTGCRLVGWNTRPGGNGTNYSDGQVMNISRDIHLYARWAPIVQ